jgi:hypothetical protein
MTVDRNSVTGNPQSGVRTRLDSGLLLILALPWAIVRLDSAWLFAYATSSQGFIDPWVYFGFFLDLAQHLRTFKGAYFTTRITWTVPGAIVYHLFSPVVATYVLHLVLYYAATISLYLILEATVNRRAAFLATLLMGFHSYFLWSVGWAYIDGVANTYLLLTMLTLTFAARSATKAWLVAAGVLAAMAIYCQFFLIVFAPLVLGYYHFARRQTGGKLFPGAWKPFAWGFAGVTLVFGLFNMAVNGRFLFFINSVGTAAKLVINHNPYNDSSYRWLAGASWLILPVITTTGAFVCLARRKKIPEARNAEFILFWQRYYLLSVAVMLFWQLVGQPVLQLSTYASYLMPGVFLALGSQLAIVVQKLSRKQFAFLSAAVILVLVVPYASPLESGLMIAVQRHTFFLSLSLGTAAVVIIGRGIRRVTTLAVIVLGLSLATLNAATGPRFWKNNILPQDPASQKAALLAIVDSVRTVQSLDPKGNLYFWYDHEGRLGPLYRSVASTYLWAYRLQSEDFPRVGPKLPPVQRHLLILAEDGEAAERQAQIALEQAGLGAKLCAQRTIHREPFKWEAIEIEVIEGTPGSAARIR